MPKQAAAVIATTRRQPAVQPAKANVLATPYAEDEVEAAERRRRERGQRDAPSPEEPRTGADLLCEAFNAVRVDGEPAQSAAVRRERLRRSVHQGASRGAVFTLGDPLDRSLLRAALSVRSL